MQVGTRCSGSCTLPSSSSFWFFGKGNGRGYRWSQVLLVGGLFYFNFQLMEAQCRNNPWKSYGWLCVASRSSCFLSNFRGAEECTNIEVPSLLWQSWDDGFFGCHNNVLMFSSYMLVVDFPTSHINCHMYLFLVYWHIHSFIPMI